MTAATDAGPATPFRLSDPLHARIEAEITSLRLPPGTALREATLGRRFGVSRTPVREVLQHLLRDGLVERQGRFYRVIRLSEPEVRDLCEVREALECMAMALAIPRDPALPGALRHLLDAQLEALGEGDLDRFSHLDGLFHLRISEGSGNAMLVRHLAMLHQKVALVRGMEQRRPLWRTSVVEEHRRIVDALDRGADEIAVDELRYHIRTLARRRRQGTTDATAGRPAGGSAAG